ncbi:GyrI-like domain-containing protein [Caproicibacter sp.]|uniref:GyrI-like domain-containing protein n=1 Tax=Caproicibacter sp. TaxID=2814884 RepID=UPI003988D41B
MKIKLQKRDAFLICGYYVRTGLETCGRDFEKLWEEYHFSRKNNSIFKNRDDFYGLMWKTEDHGSGFFYLIGMEINATEKLPPNAAVRQIPPAEYAVASVSASVSATDAWTDFYYKTLPETGLIPAAGHVYDFEYYPDGNGQSYELWTPVQKRTV